MKATVVLLAAMLVLIGIAIYGASAGPPRHCTHGLSSVGPVVVVNGKVTGSTTPHTEACLP